MLAGLRTELEKYSARLAELPYAVVFSKMDLVSPEAKEPVVDVPDASGIYHVSAVTGRGVHRLLEGCWQQLETARGGDEAERGEW